MRLDFEECKSAFPSWQQKYADEQSIDLPVERTVESHKDWLTQFN